MIIINFASKQIESQSHRTENWMGDGWLVVPPAMEEKLMSLYPYIILTVADGVVTAVEDDVTARQNAPSPEPTPTTEEVLSQTVANLTLENFDLKNQMQTLAQTIAMMQIGGQA